MTIKTGLFFGTFNPIHKGHLAIADFMANQTDLEEVWLVVSPHNPLKKEKDLLEDADRLKLVKIAVRDHPGIKVCDAEFHLGTPSYTINTLHYLTEKYPQRKFVLIIGEDNLRSFHRWKDYEKILDAFSIYVYPRKVNANESRAGGTNHPSVKRFDVRLLPVSATAVRQKVKEGKNISGLVPPEVAQEINAHQYYR